MFVYFVLVACWLLSFFFPDLTMEIGIGTNVFLGLIYLCAGGGFVVYGGRLYLMLKQFPIQSRGRQNKLREVIEHSTETSGGMGVSDLHNVFRGTSCLADHRDYLSRHRREQFLYRGLLFHSGDSSLGFGSFHPPKTSAKERTTRFCHS